MSYFDDLISEASAKAPAGGERTDTVKAIVRAALDEGVTEEAPILRRVLRARGFRHGGLDALDDGDLQTIIKAARTVDMTLRRERRTYTTQGAT